MAGRVQGDPLPPTEADHLGVVEANRRCRRLEQPREAGGGADPHPPLQRERVAVAAPRRRVPRAPGPVVGGVLHVDVGWLGAIPDHAEIAVGDDVGAGLVAHPAGAAEVIGMAVGDDHGVHPLERDAGAGEPPGELLERRAAWQARIDDGDASLVGDDVAVDVAEAGHVDRQLAAQHAGSDLGDLGGGVLLLLATGAIGHLRSVRVRRRARRPVTGSARWPGPCTPLDGRSAGCCCGRTAGCRHPERPSAARRHRSGTRRGGRAAAPARTPGPAAASRRRAGRRRRPLVRRHRSRRRRPRRHGRRRAAAAAGWVGKPHACWTGAGATTAQVLVFLDADVRPGPHLLDGLAAVACDDAIVSVQPWHDAARSDRAGQRRGPDGQRRLHRARPSVRTTWPSGRCWP